MATPGVRVVFTVLATLAKFESDINIERTKGARKLAQARGLQRACRSVSHDTENVRAAKALLCDPTL